MGENDKSTKIDVTSSAVEKGLDIVKGFLDKIIGPPAEELGGILQDRVKLWRVKNQINILQKAEEHISKKGITTKKIAMKIFVPLLEDASLEEETTLQDKWVALLVNYVDLSQKLKNAIFPYILSQLSSNEVKALDQLIKRKGPQKESFLKKELGLDETELDNLVRLSILGRLNSYKGTQPAIFRTPNQEITIDLDGNPQYALSKLGERFINACRLKS